MPTDCSTVLFIARSFLIHARHWAARMRLHYPRAAASSHETTAEKPAAAAQPPSGKATEMPAAAAQPPSPEPSSGLAEASQKKVTFVLTKAEKRELERKARKEANRQAKLTEPAIAGAASAAG